MTAKRVLSVGQCMADHGSIARTLGKSFGAEVVPADSADEVLEQLHRDTFALVLVNRILDGDGSSGLEVVRTIKSDARGSDVPVMLVSNHEEAQGQAVEAGAAPGFGKAALGRPEMLERVSAFLGEGGQ